ncbi:hypothetical protein [Blastococcus sp. TF02-09]|uniref:hypothetical protein n=1 Tax=Blastococcus sp. TF02-09 TaxID=2250576 RepID=UPI001F181058|nr:hypothetical protein [Blastococcus sp. TF02-9]
MADALPVLLQLGEPRADLGDGQGALGSQVDQALLGAAQARQLGVEVAAQLARGALLIGHRLAHPGLDAGREVRRQGQVGVLALDGVLNPLDTEVRQVADAFLAAPTEEVEVGPAAPLALGQDQPMLPPGLLAAAAEEHALEEVRVDVVAGAPPGAQVGDFLDPLKEPLVNERVMPTGVEGALVDQDAGVVGVGQDLAQLLQRDRLGREALRRPAPQAEVGHRLRQPVQAVLAGGVELKGLADQRGALRVDGHAGHQAALEVLADVAVTKGRLVDRAAALGLLAHLVADVLAVLSGAELVDGAHDAERQPPDRGLIDVLGGRQQLGLRGPQLHDDLGAFLPVPVHPAELVDDDGIDVALGLDALQHRLEGRPALHARTRAAGLDVLIDDLDAQPLGLALAGRALGRDGDALGVVVRGHLADRADPQVEHGPFRRVQAAAVHAGAPSCAGWPSHPGENWR